MTLPASDDFGRADGALGANWGGSVGGDLTISTNRVTGTAATDNSMMWVADTPGAAHSVQASIASSVAIVSGPVARHSATDGVVFTAYVAGNYKIMWYNAGVYTQIGATYAVAPVVGDVLKITAKGASFEAFVNGVSRISGSNASAPSVGTGGLYVYGTGGYLDNFELNNLLVPRLALLGAG
jgi:hypothetical protein